MQITENEGWLLALLDQGTAICLWPDGKWRLYRPSTDDRAPIPHREIQHLLDLGAIHIRTVRGVKTAFITDTGRANQLAAYLKLETAKAAADRRELDQLLGRRND